MRRPYIFNFDKAREALGWQLDLFAYMISTPRAGLRPARCRLTGCGRRTFDWYRQQNWL